MTRTNLPSNKPSTVDELRAAIAARFPPGGRGTGAELRAAIEEISCGLGQPEEPGVYKDLRCPETLWLSWFRPTWPPPPRKDGTYRSPLDKAQLTLPGDPNTGEGAGMMFHYPSIARQGIKLLGAEEPQNDGYRISLVTRFIASLNGKESLLDTHHSEAQLRLLDALVTWGRRLRENIAALPQHTTIGNGSSADIEAYENLARHSPDFFGGPLYVFPEEADREYIALLEKIGTNGKNAAAKLRKAPPVSQEEADTWAPWLPPAKGGFPARHTRLVLALWDDIVLPHLERAAEEQRKHEAPIRFPQPVGQAVAIMRNATVGSLKKKAMACGEDWAEHVMVDSPGMQLFLEYDGQGPGSTLQSILTGGLLRTYLLTHAACADQAGMSPVDGTFAWEERAVFQKYVAPGKKAGGHQINLMREDMAQLLKMRVVALDGIKMAQPEPLVNLYTEEKTGRMIYTHAKIVLTFLRERFSQIPRAVLRLDSRDIPLALGLATLARSNAVKILAGNNTQEMSLAQLAAVCGEDTRAGARKSGTAYWSNILDRLSRIARTGDIGELENVDVGADRVASESRVRFSLHERLATSYAPLVKTHHARRRLAARGKG